MQKILIGIATALVIIAAGTYIINQGNTTPATTAEPTNDIQVTNSAATTTAKTYTLADVATHSSQASCWTAINGNVYDVTKWIGQHPGGPQAILRLCGKDGSDAFNGKHGGQPRPATELASLLIGTLSN